MSDASVTAENVLLYDRCNRQLLEDSVDPIKNGVLVVYVLLEFRGALVTESHVAVHLSILVPSSKQHNIFWELDLQGKQE
jgi:hypothetical protein